MSLQRSWVGAANDPQGEFPLNNLPYGVFTAPDVPEPSLGVAIGDRVLDVRGAASKGFLPFEDALRGHTWNAVMALGPEAWTALRGALQGVLGEGASAFNTLEPLLFPLSAATLHMPFAVAEFTDFYAGRHHAENVGTMFRGAENALPPNWLSMPIGYNGRASSVVVSGTPVRRPWGQVKAPDAVLPRFAPSQRFDIELEMGAVIGTSSRGPVTVAEADAMIFGYVLLNDWSARDIQAWEYQPLGPFQSKATATTVSPWIVPRAALEPFRIPTPPRERELLPHLRETGPMLYDVDLAVDLAPRGGASRTIAQTNMRELYYAPAQQLAHHTTSGCPMRTGDLLGTGTISGPERDQCGSLLELAWGGREPLHLGDETRTFLEDGDTVRLRGHARGEGYRIGFGECAGTVLPAKGDPYGGEPYAR